ncbi:MAG: hypothetical protein ACK5OS_00955 [Chryseotalea sp.]
MAHDENLDKFYFNFLTAEKVWEQREWTGSTIFYSSGISRWYSSASFLVVMAKNNPEFIYRWSRDFNTFYKDTHASDNTQVLGTKLDDVPVYIVNNSTVGIFDRIVRFNGINWKASSFDYYNDAQGTYYFYGDDFVVRSTDYNVGKRLEYNPNTNTFLPDNNSVPGWYARVAVGINSFCYDKNLYYRFPNGNWQNIGSAPSSDEAISLTSGNNLFVLFDIYPYPHERTIYVKNGQFNSALGLGGYIHYNNLRFKNIGVSSNFVISYPSYNYSNYPYDYENTKKLILTRLNYGTSDQIGTMQTQSDFVVDNIVVNDGNKNVITKFRFNDAFAQMDPNGLTAYYSDVDVIPNASSTGQQTKGFIKYNFFNKNYFQGNFLQGQNFKTQMFDQNGNLISQTETLYDIKLNDYIRSNGTIINQGYEVRIVATRQFKDGQSKQRDIYYSNQNGKQIETQEYFQVQENYIPVKKDVLTTKFKYAHEVYPSLTLKNLISIPVSTEVYTDKAGLIGAEVKTLKFWGQNQIPMFHRTYTWDGYESSDFNAWTEGTNPPAQWRLTSRIDDVDLVSGLVKESSDAIGIKSTTIWDFTRKLPLAIVSNASQNQVFYNGFEDATNNFSTDAYSGTKSSTTISNVVLPSAGTYTLAWWQKQGSNNWQYMEQTITNNISIGGSGLLIDEVRLLPQNAYMTTYAYDTNGNKITECDANSNCMHYEYDEFNRIKTVRDAKRNIIEHNVYQLD